MPMVSNDSLMPSAMLAVSMITVARSVVDERLLGVAEIKVCPAQVISVVDDNLEILNAFHGGEIIGV
jgi:hypothetical protein